MDDIEKKLAELINTPRNDFETRYEQIKDRLITHEKKNTRRWSWKKVTAIAASLIVIISTVITSILLLKPDETRYLMTDITITNSYQDDFNTQLSEINLSILDLADQNIMDYKIYQTKVDNITVGGLLNFNGTSNNDFYQVTLKIYSGNVDINTENYIGFVNNKVIHGKTYHYTNSITEVPFTKISCYYIGDDYSLIMDYQGITGDIWGLLNILLQQN